MLGFLGNIQYDHLKEDLETDKNKISVDDLDDHNKESGISDEWFIEWDDILSRKLSPERKNRVITFFKGIRKNATISEVRAALVSIVISIFEMNCLFYEIF